MAVDVQDGGPSDHWRVGTVKMVQMFSGEDDRGCRAEWEEPWSITTWQPRSNSPPQARSSFRFPLPPPPMCKSKKYTLSYTYYA